MGGLSSTAFEGYRLLDDRLPRLDMISKKEKATKYWRKPSSERMHTFQIHGSREKEEGRLRGIGLGIMGSMEGVWQHMTGKEARQTGIHSIVKAHNEEWVQRTGSTLVVTALCCTSNKLNELCFKQRTRKKEERYLSLIVVPERLAFDLAKNDGNAVRSRRFRQL